MPKDRLVNVEEDGIIIYRFGKCPFGFRPLLNNPKIKTNFLGYSDQGLVQSVPGDWVLGGNYEENDAEEIYNFMLRDSDVWIVSYPKSGTTWMQYTMWLLMNDLDYENDERLDIKSPFLDLDQCTPVKKYIAELSAKREELLNKDGGVCDDPEFLSVLDSELEFLSRTRVQDADSMSRFKPRLLKSHLPFSLMPPDLLDRNKVVYVARDPRDVVVSYFHHHRLIRHHEFIGEFEQFLEFFINEEVLWSPFWKHIEQAWRQRENKNLLIIFFSDMKKNMGSVVDKLISFLGLEGKYSDSQIQGLLEKLSIDAMRGNEAADDTELMVRLGIFKEGEGSFIRKGKSGGFKEKYGQAMYDKLEAWKNEAVRKIGPENLPMDKLWPE